ncbi:PLAC8 family-domain-containing protein [Infundibulicybe gibba]|nr:PLAC8 family-domain-containing protein [Infundibulicybe gibba]
MSYPYNAPHESYTTTPYATPPAPQTPGQYPPPGYSGYPDPSGQPQYHYQQPSGSPPPQQQFYQPQNQGGYPSPGPIQYVSTPPAQPQQVYVVQEKPPPPVVVVTQQPHPAQQPQMIAAMPQAQAAPGKVTKQPKAKADMVVKGNRNCKNKPYGPLGTREWSTGLCDCMDENCGTCCLAMWCPCIVYGQNKSRFEYLSSHDSPDPSGGGSCCSGDCGLHGCLTSFCAFGWALQISTRGAIRQRYKIDGGWIGDCFTALCCTPCQLAQEDREIALEENSFPRGVGLSTGSNYHGPAAGGKPAKVGK